MTEITAQTVYFQQPGADNTQRTLELAGTRARSLGLKKVLIATTGGETGVRAVNTIKGLDVIVITHSTGFDAPNVQELTEKNRSLIEAAGGRVLTCQHALGGVNRAVRNKLGSYQLDEIIAFTLRLFGQGMKVAVELSLMAADAGAVRTDEPVLVVAGTGQGADTAVVVLPTNAQTFFELKVIEIVCMPSPNHPAFV